MRGHAFPGLLELARQSAERALCRCLEQLEPHRPLAIADATCGNGHDTLFLARLACRAAETGRRVRVVGFDVQPAALAATSARLRENGLERLVLLSGAGHERLGEYFPPGAPLAAETRSVSGAAKTDPPGEALAVVMYNLGYLPGADKEVTTRPATTVASLEAARQALVPGGLLCVHAYAGHTGGADETDVVEDWCRALPFSRWSVACYRICNKRSNPEVLFLAERQPNRRAADAQPAG